ncbi:type II toxin-antitoxin system RelE/ParE family toxin [Gryllotalpicola sp.]|uniref:type II toxin-antitoxin system RelE/ParE family toxin n=1 Tax=Gryllotalpicola sp. TaxID=1932787 RepID=UPI00260742F0|nr:type II toxin-antitoxin system RelE/ParE family toxin [Gryllotalpicola sp.]
MTYRVRLRRMAGDDYVRAIDWYLSEAPHQVHRFQDEVEAAIARVIERPQLPPIIYSGLRHVVTHVFPYQLWYLVIEDEELIDVVAIVHERQDRARLDGRF